MKAAFFIILAIFVIGYILAYFEKLNQKLKARITFQSQEGIIQFENESSIFKSTGREVRILADFNSNYLIIGSNKYIGYYSTRLGRQDIPEAYLIEGSMVFNSLESDQNFKAYITTNTLTVKKEDGTILQYRSIS